mgnify:CR=1 FL=1
MIVKIRTSGILETASWNIRETVRRLNLPEDIAQRISEPSEQLCLRIHPVMPDGRTVHAEVFVVRHNDVLGPAKGGIRMTSTVTLEEVAGLAMEMTWKTALIGVPFGGGKAGIRADPSALTLADKEVLIRAFTRAVRRLIGPEIYVPAPDMGTDECDMGHISDCISHSGGTSITPGCFVTGKPLMLGGITGRREATGYGVVATIAAACERLGLRLPACRVAVQGFGNVGSVAAHTIAARGATVVAVSDVRGGTVNEDGLDIPKLIEYAKATGSVDGFPGGRKVSSDDVLLLDCDILIPAAADSVIHAENAEDIRATMIAEGANGPLTPAADQALAARNVFVIPDILCNSGGVFVSYLEYTQETQREQMTGDEVERRLSRRLQSTFDAVFERAKRTGETMRHAAMDIAVLRVVDGIVARGLLP